MIKMWFCIYIEKKLPPLQVLKNFLDTAEADVRSLISLYSEVVSAVLITVFILLVNIVVVCTV